MSNQNKSYEITPAELRKYKGYENVSDNEANEICFQLRELSLILYDLFQMELDKEEKRSGLLHPLKTRQNEINN